MENVQITKEIFDRLDAVAAKLGVAAGYIWPVMIKQARIAGIRDMVLGVSLLIFVGYSAKPVIKAINDDNFGIGFMGSCAIIVATIFGIISCNFAIGELLNPEYYALEFLKSALTN